MQALKIPASGAIAKASGFQGLAIFFRNSKELAHSLRMK